MATLNEDYVSFEISKLLKEKGFDEVCYRIYDTKEEELLGTDGIEFQNHEVDEETITAPTLQMAMKWLREKHKLFIQICIIPYTTITIEQKYYLFTIHKDRRMLAFRKDFPSEYYFTYEQACEDAIKYCLENLI